MFRMTTTVFFSLVSIVPTLQGAEPSLTDQAPEWAIKISEILRGGDPSKPVPSPLTISKSAYTWEWLRTWHQIGSEESLTSQQFRGSKESFTRLDRNGDGKLEAADFDWSDQSPFVKQQAAATSLFSKLNTDGNGGISPTEWQALFDEFAGEKKSLSTDDLRRLLSSSTQSRRTTVMPSRWMRLFGYLNGELGSFNSGPNPGEIAPNFQLLTHDGKDVIQLSDYRDRKPVVLVFGNFT